jgi:hypothetical protein
LGDARLGLVDALPHNRYLERLGYSGNGMSEEFARERLLPAVHANTSLRELYATGYHEEIPSARVAELFVRERAARGCCGAGGVIRRVQRKHAMIGLPGISQQSTQPCSAHSASFAHMQHAR